MIGRFPIPSTGATGSLSGQVTELLRKVYHSKQNHFWQEKTRDPNWGARVRITPSLSEGRYLQMIDVALWQGTRLPQIASP